MSPNFKTIDYKDALNTEAPIYNEVNFVSNVNEVRSSSIPTNVVKTLVQFYLRKQRAQEEIVIVQEEMKATLSYWRDQLNFLVECASQQTSFGLKYLLQERIFIVNSLTKELEQLFNSVTNIELQTEYVNRNLDVCIDEMDGIYSDSDCSSEDEEDLCSSGSDIEDSDFNGLYI